MNLTPCPSDLRLNEHVDTYINSKQLVGIQLDKLGSILIANRGEIAVRIIQTIHELGGRAIAIYSYEDRYSLHRQKADEAYQIGYHGQYTPVGAYLAIDEIINIAKAHNVHMIHPGYGFLSENSDFARKVAAAGMIFIGPSAETISLMGDKTKAKFLAYECKVAFVPGTRNPINSIEEIEAFVEEHGLPIIMKAAMGGGGRGMRVINERANLMEHFERAKSEAKSSFGDESIFLEKYLIRPKHIEVQILADNFGNIIHLLERDCSVQRRHQKIVEMAPSRSLTQQQKERIYADAIKIAKVAKYSNAGTVEFLVAENSHYFIEMNPRIQVEHTVTEEITGIDIVAAQIKIALGKTLEDMSLLQKNVVYRGYAIQCRVTTEDPSNNFSPDYGRIDVYRSSSGNGVRLDVSNCYTGAEVQPFYDSMLVKCTCFALHFEDVVKKMIRSLLEFYIRGVKTNIPFLVRLLTHTVFLSSSCWTTFIEDTPELLNYLEDQNRAQKLLKYIAEVAVNGSMIAGQKGDAGLKTDLVIPLIYNKDENTLLDTSKPCKEGWRNIIVTKGPKAFAKAVRENQKGMITDTTMRDAHQSLLATRIRTIDLVNVASATSYALSDAFSLEMWGGATFDVAFRFLHENPWDRLKKLRKRIPNIPFQMLLRGANGLAYSSLPDNAIQFFCEQAKKYGIDIFRVFDALNDIENLAVGVEAVVKSGAVCEATICYTSDFLNPKCLKYTLQYYLDMVELVLKLNPHILGIKDMAGTMKPKAAEILIGEIRRLHPDIPIHVHTHDSAGTGVASMAAALMSGADVVDVCTDCMSGGTSQPSIGALIASCEMTKVKLDFNMKNLHEIDLYWDQVRTLYSCFLSDSYGCDTDVYSHEIPGGQLTNLKFQAHELGLASQWRETKKAYILANKLMGDIIKVTPTSKAVGDLAQFMVQNKLDYDSVIKNAKTLAFPSSVLDFFQGLMGNPYKGFPEPLRTNILEGKREKLSKRPGLTLKRFDFVKVRNDLKKKYGCVTDTDLASYSQFPDVFEDYKTFCEIYGDLSYLPSQYFFGKPEVGKEFIVQIGAGKLLYIKLLAVGALNELDGKRTVYFEVNGELQAVLVKDKKSNLSIATRLKADSSKLNHIGAPMSGIILELKAEKDMVVKSGETVAVLTAMKMEIAITVPKNGVIKDVIVSSGDTVESGDLLLTLSE